MVWTTQTGLCSCCLWLPITYWFVDCGSLVLGSWLEVLKHSLDMCKKNLLVPVVKMTVDQEKVLCFSNTECWNELWHSSVIPSEVQLPLFRLLRHWLGAGVFLVAVSFLLCFFCSHPRGQLGLVCQARSDGQAWLATAALLHLAFPFLFSSIFAFCFSLHLSLSLVPSTFPSPSLSWLTAPATAMTTGRPLTWPVECLQSASCVFAPCVWILDTWICWVHWCCHSFCSHSAAVWILSVTSMERI